MALLTYNGTDFDSMIGSATITGTGVTISAAGVSSSGFTAPNLTNKVTGCWVWVSSLPSSGNYIVELLESGVVKATSTINFADMKLGANYVRYTTPYQFATLTASAYTCRVRHSGVGSGQCRTAASGVWFQFSYDLTVATPTINTHNVWIAGFNNSGLTAKNLVLTGLLNQWGTGTSINIGGSTVQDMGAAVVIGNGGTLSFDQTASTTLSLLGSIYTTVNGTYDQRPPSNKAVVSRLIVDSVSNGQQGLVTANGTNGGRFLTRGATYDIYTTYASGLGTAASPMIVSIPWDADVGDEIVIGGGTAYNLNEVRYVKTRNSSTSFVLSATPGGAESALANTHAVGSHIANLQRNSIIQSLATNRGFYITNTSSTAPSDFSYTRYEYADCTSGKALVFDQQSAVNSLCDGIVHYKNSITGRQVQQLQGSSIAKTYTGIVMFDTQGGNFFAQSGIAFSSTNNKTLVDSFLFNGPGSTTTCAHLSFGTSSTSNIIRNCHSYGANSANSASGYAIGLFSSSGNTFNDCTVNAARRNAVYLATGSGNTFNNCKFGNIATNSVDITCLDNTLNETLFNACTFGSASLITNYLNQLDGSIAAFQDMDSNTNKHRWYTNKGSFHSSGSGLSDTTVRTAGSLSLAIKPENNTTGAELVFKIPANPTSQVNVFGYLYRNAAFSSGTLKVELFLPGTLLTGTPDATVTLSTTTLAWLPWALNAYYSGTVARYATVRIAAITNTAGAYAFVDDIYDAQTGNKVAGLDLWDEGQISPILVAADYSSIPNQTTQLVEAALADNFQQILDEQKLPNLLIKSELS